MSDGHDALLPASRRSTSEYIAFLDRQAELFAEVRIAGLARLQIEAGDCVLDAGCGPGTDSFDLESAVGREGRVVAIDLSRDMVEVARQRAAARASGVEFRVDDVHQLDLPDDSFDLVRCVLLLLHVQDPLRAVQEMVRVLRPGGRLVCIDVDHQMDAIDATDLELAERVLRGRYARLKNPRIGRQLRGFMASAGLSNIDTEVLSRTTTSWNEFNALAGDERPTLFEFAVQAGIATEPEARTLEQDLRDRDSRGEFFGCEVRMRSIGTKPGPN